MEIEPIFTDQHWKNFIKDLKNIESSEFNSYGNKIEVIMKIKNTSSLTPSEFFDILIQTLESIIHANKLSFKNNALSFSVKFNELIPALVHEKYINHDDIKEEVWKNIIIMNVCLLRVYTVVEDHFFQAPLLQINSVRMHQDKEYPINFTCKIMNEDMANAYKYVPKK